MANETKVVEQRIIQRLINTIADYEEGGKFYSQVIPLHTQAYAIYDSQEKSGLYYVFGDGVHTYTEIRNGESSLESAHEYAVFDESWIALINSKANLDYMNFELAKRQYISNLVNEITEENEKSTTLYPSIKAITTIKAELKTDIHAEANTRATVDAGLQDAIDEEEISRINTDNNLSNAITQEASTRAEKDLELSQDINTEIINRQNGDNILQDNINTEVLARTDADSVLTTAINNEIVRAKNIEATLSTRIDLNDSELETISGDESVSGSIKAIAKSYSNDAYSSATNYTDTCENNIRNDLEAEVLRAKNAEDSLSADIITENTRAINAEENLDSIKADKDDVYTKAEIDTKLTSAMRFKGTKPTYNDLPKSNNEIGDMWNILADGSNYAWDGESWDKLSETIDLSPFATKEEVTIVDNGLQDNIDTEANTREANDNYLDNKLTGFIGRIWKNYDETDLTKGWLYTKYNKTDGSYALLFNENDSGGSQYYNKTLDSLQYVGTNDGNDGVYVQIYAKNKTSNIGARLAAAPTGIYYTNGKKNGSYTAFDEIVTKADIAAIDFSPYATNISLNETKTELQNNINTVSTNLNTEVTYRKDLANRLWKSYNEADPTKGYFYTKYTLPSTSYSLVFNESDGGGTQVYDKTANIISYVGANLEEGQSDKESAINVQIYSKNKTSNEGVRLNISSQKAYYLKGSNKTNTPERELATIADITSEIVPINTKIDQKIDKYTTLDNLNENRGTIVQYVGESGTYNNGYFYKYYGEQGVTFTPIEDTYTITVNVTTEDFKTLLTQLCEGRPFTAEDVTHGQIGYYSADRLSFSADTDDGKFFHITMTPAEFEAAGVVFEPAIGPRQGVRFVCNLTDTTWKQINVQPLQDLSSYALIENIPTKTSQLNNDSDFTTNEALQAQVTSLTQQIKDLKLLIPQEVFDASTARSAMNASGKVTLCEDINLGVLNLGGGMFAAYNTSINLNNHVLQAGPTGGRALLLVRGTSNYTFNGKGQVIDTADDSSPVWCASTNASVTINDGTFIAQGHTECIYCELGIITINGGEFKTEVEDKRYLLNCKDANYQAGTAKIIVKGGKFWDFDPHDCLAEGEHTNFCADGYTTTFEEIDGHTVYTVVKA